MVLVGLAAQMLRTAFVGTAVQKSFDRCEVFKTRALAPEPAETVCYDLFSCSGIVDKAIGKKAKRRIELIEYGPECFRVAGYKLSDKGGKVLRCGRTLCEIVH